jgi:hypothetical protein
MEKNGETGTGCASHGDKTAVCGRDLVGKILFELGEDMAADSFTMREDITAAIPAQPGDHRSASNDLDSISTRRSIRSLLQARAGARMGKNTPGNQRSSQDIRIVGI